MPVDKVFVYGPKNIFVFGSNEAGIHGAGAAATAYEHYGAIQGQGFGLMGNSYGIPTKDKYLRSLTLGRIQGYVNLFLAEAKTKYSDYNFFVTRIGCGFAGYTDEQIAPLFVDPPKNLELPHNWRELAKRVLSES